MWEVYLSTVSQALPVTLRRHPEEFRRYVTAVPPVAARAQISLKRRYWLGYSESGDGTATGLLSGNAVGQSAFPAAMSAIRAAPRDDASL